MEQFRTCEHCGAHLDADEKCDCQKREIEEGEENND